MNAVPAMGARPLLNRTDNEEMPVLKIISISLNWFTSASILNSTGVDEDSLALDTIAKVGPGGEYLTCRHTLENCRKVPWQPEISARSVKNGPDFNAQILLNIQTQKKKILNEYHRPDLDPEIKSRLDRYLADLGIESQFDELVKSPI